MGPSGSGKSSLMNLIGALDRPTSGEMWINGRALSEMNRDELADLRNETLGFVFQQFNLLAASGRVSRMSACPFAMPARMSATSTPAPRNASNWSALARAWTTGRCSSPAASSSASPSPARFPNAPHPSGRRTDRRARHQDHRRDHASDAGPQQTGHHRRRHHARDEVAAYAKPPDPFSRRQDRNQTPRIPTSSARAMGARA
jgi:ABC-type oligopeptide transport system ATPase subunit